MSGFVISPNLPVNAKTIVLGEKYSNIIANPLKKQGIEPVFVPDNPSLDPRLSGHADLSVFHLGGEGCLLSMELKGTAFEQKLRDFGAEISFLDKKLEEKYPNDATLNACAVGKTLTCQKSSVAKQIVDYFTNPGCKIIDVKQGYSRCSVCVVNDNSIITADRGIAKAASAADIDVLLISPGFVKLAGFDYGFIGGAAFKLSAERLAFTGVLDKHPDRAKILDFLREKRVKPVFLTDLPIFDIGGAVPLLEKNKPD